MTIHLGQLNQHLAEPGKAKNNKQLSRQPRSLGRRLWQRHPVGDVTPAFELVKHGLRATAVHATISRSSSACGAAIT